MSREEPIAALVPAAGRGRRMGAVKPLLPLRGRPLLEHVLHRLARCGLRPVVVVLGYEAERIRAAVRWPPEAIVVENPAHARGMGTSLRAGLAALEATPASACAVFLADQLVPDDVVERVTASFRRTRRQAARPLFSAPGGERTPGHPVFLRRALWDRMRELDGDAGARALFSRDPSIVEDVPVEREPPLDVDTPADWRALLDLESDGG